MKPLVKKDESGKTLFLSHKQVESYLGPDFSGP